MQITTEKLKKNAKWLIAVAAACIVIFLGLQNIGTVANAVSWALGLILPLIIGVVFAIIINVPMRFFENHFWPKSQKKTAKKLRRPCALVVSLIIIIGILAGVFSLVIPELIEAIKVIVNGAIKFINDITNAQNNELSDSPLIKAIMSLDWKKTVTALQDWLTNQSGNIMNTAFVTISSILGGIFDTFISFVFSIYILFNKEKLKAQLCRFIKIWMPKRFGGWLIHASAVANINLRNFISGQTLEALILGVLCVVGMLILRIPYAPMVSALVGVTALLPVVGAYIGVFVGAFMILTVSPVKALVFIIFLIVLQQLEGNLIYPRVMGSKVKLPAMWILAAVTIGGALAGPIGMLAAVPAASTIYILLREATDEREAKIKACTNIESDK